MKKYFAILIVVLLLGCSQAQEEVVDTKKAEVEAAVTWYCALLADGYRNLNMNPLAQVATVKRATEAFHHMAAMGEGGLKMDTTLKKIEFGAFRVTAPERAEVDTEEVWDYVFLNTKTGKVRFDNSVRYSMTYELEKQEGRWLVADIAIRQASEKKDSSFIYKRPADIPQGASTKPKQEGH